MLFYVIILLTCLLGKGVAKMPEVREAEVVDGVQRQRQNTTVVKSTVTKGITFGSCLAIVISYTAWQSIPWAILHGLLSWVYVVYYIIVH